MTKRMWTLPVLAIALIALGSGVGFAIPSLSGPTGVVATPTAMVAPQGELQAAISYQSMQSCGLAMYDPEGEGTDLDAWSVQALAGVSNVAELWAAYTSVDDSDSTDIWGVGGKFQLTKEPDDDATVAIGASYSTWSDLQREYQTLQVTGQNEYGAPQYGLVPDVIKSDTDVYTAYLVISKDLSPLSGKGWEWGSGGGTQILGSVGVMYIDIDPDKGDSDSLTEPFINMEFVGESGTKLGLEYRWDDSDLDCDAVFSAVLSYPVSDTMTVEVGSTNASPIGLGLDDQDWFARMAVSLPM